MFARVSIFEGPADGLDKSIQVAKEQVVPSLREVDGSAGIIVVGDRSTGRSYALTLWRSAEAMKASEETANRLRTETSSAAGEEIVAVERTEVLLEERW